jgi:hypothetical protein
MLAAGCGATDCLGELMGAGADRAASDEEGKTALEHAAAWPEAVSLLHSRTLN